MKVSVCICTYNRSRSLDQTLAQIRKLRIPLDIEYELIIVNNNSNDGTDDIIDRHKAAYPFIVKLNESNQGLSFARNTAVRACSGDLILWTDDDVLVPEDWLDGYASAVRQWPEASYFGGPIEPHFESEPPRWLSRNIDHLQGAYSLLWTSDEVAPIGGDDAPIGANMAIRADVSKRYPFDTKLGRIGGSLIGMEDTELFRYLKANGHQGVWVGCSKVKHVIGKEKQTLRYIWKWFDGSGRTAARLVGGGKSYREAVDTLSKIRKLDSIEVATKQINDSWWSIFFSGPFWMRAMKAAAYYSGFHREVLRMQRDTHPAPEVTPRVDLQEK
jgi:glycosyltransferase involved in cell wall biosynthesis